MQGGGFAALTPKKLRQIRFAAEVYNTSHVTSKNLCLVGAAVGKDGAIELLKIE